MEKEKLKPLTKKQIKKAGQVWAGEILSSTDLTWSYDYGCTDAEIEAILRVVHDVANKYVLEGKAMGTIQEIINRVRKEF